MIPMQNDSHIPKSTSLFYERSNGYERNTEQSNGWTQKKREDRKERTRKEKKRKKNWKSNTY